MSDVRPHPAAAVSTAGKSKHSDGGGESLREVVSARIHPSIGVARVGDSITEFFIGPEVDEPTPQAAGSYKDKEGALKREAARFRIYGYDAAGLVVAELTCENAEIEWTVQVANTKAAWYGFQIAMDIPEAPLAKDPTVLRNATITGADRDRLAIEPGPRSITGPNQSGGRHRFDSGKFMGVDVYLGELRTDEAGRLVFLGGHGKSASPGGAPLTTFANNDGWHDDVSDGPVTAVVKIGENTLPVDPAWVVVAPPNYAPVLTSVRTMYDLLYDANLQSGRLPFPARVSFRQHIHPIISRLVGLQWVNDGFATKFGWTGRENFLEPGYLGRLASGEASDRGLRQQVLNTFRIWERDGLSPVPWPWIYGDSMSIPPISPRQHSVLSSTQMRLLEIWRDGDFDPDLDASVPHAIDEVPLGEQPAMLDRAALTFCLADAFHPGCELTWPMRHASMYAAPFRLRHRAKDDPEPWFGSILTPARALSVNGPLYGQTPGSLTRWMAVPWQTDAASCRSGYTANLGDYDPYLPTFWPARVPNHVLTHDDYLIVMDSERTLEERLEAFERRAVWDRWLTGKTKLTQMVAGFGKFGVVETHPGPGDESFPAEILVESEVTFTQVVNPLRNLYTLHVPEARDAELAEAAIATVVSAVDASTYEADEVAAAYYSKVDRF
ncbi:MAG: hypothetical protein QOH12_393 [Solirubrobacteraceae bacterium]|jgi:hypothetical protein|nr:hypothetical protein [Solirubrobacteraceae bacterium]